MMMLQLHTESSHPTFRDSSAFERGELRSKGHGKKSVRFNGSEENIELLLRRIISAKQLSVYGAMADLCKELAKYSESSVRLEAPDDLETMQIPAAPAPPNSNKETWCQTMSADSNNCLMTKSYPNYALTLV